MYIEFENKVKIVDFEDGITFSDNSKLVDYHEQDCCENVYTLEQEVKCDIYISTKW